MTHVMNGKELGGSVDGRAGGRADGSARDIPNSWRN